MNKQARYFVAIISTLILLAFTIYMFPEHMVFVFLTIAAGAFIVLIWQVADLLANG